MHSYGMFTINSTRSRSMAVDRAVGAMELVVAAESRPHRSLQPGSTQSVAIPFDGTLQTTTIAISGYADAELGIEGPAEPGRR